MSANNIDSPTLKIDTIGAIRYALDRLTNDLPPTLKYHSLWHSEHEVVEQALQLCAEENLSKLHTDLVHTAAIYHDIGFIVTRREHERISAQIGHCRHVGREVFCQEEHRDHRVNFHYHMKIFLFLMDFVVFLSLCFESGPTDHA